MNKRNYVILVLILILNSSVYGFVGDSAETIDKKNFALGILCDTELKLSPTVVPIMLFQAGIIKRFNIIVKLGMNGQTGNISQYNVFAGMETKVLLVKFVGGHDILSMNFGYHFDGRNVIDWNFIFSNRFKIIQLYIGIDSEMEFSKINGKFKFGYPIKFIMGTKIKVKKANFLIEFDIPLVYEYIYKSGLGIIFNF